MSKHESTSNPGQQLSTNLLDKSFESTERRENTEFISKNFFPIIAEVNRSIPAPPLLLWLQYFILFCQLLFGSYFVFHEEDNFPDEFITFCKIIFFGIVGDFDETYVFFILLFVIDILSFSILMIILLDYHNNHEFRTWQLKILRIWHGILFTYFIFPNFFSLFHSIASLYTDLTQKSILLFVFSLISVAYSIVHIIFLSNILNQSPFLFRSVSFHWRPPELFFMFIICTIPFVLDGLVPKSVPEYRYFPPALMIIISPYIIYKMYYLPFTYIFSNAAWSSLPVAMIVNSVFTIVRNINGIKINIYVQIFVPLACLLSCAIFFPLLLNRRNQIKNSMMYETAFQDNNPNDEDAELAYLSNLNIKSKRLAFTYLQVGIEEGADLFLDWSLSKYIYDIFGNESDVLLFLAWTVSFFPSESSSMFQTFITPDMPKLSLINRAMLYQLHRLHIFRLSASTVEAGSDLRLIQKKSDNCISKFCHVWKKLSIEDFDITHEFYKELTEIRRSTEIQWAEFLDKYPNDARFANEYSRFLLDCRCQFKEAIHYHKRADSIEKGTRLQNDRMFHRFVQKFPFYLKKGIVDTSGKLKREYLTQNNQQDQQNPQKHKQKAHNQDYTMANTIQNDNSFEDSSDDIDVVEAEQFVPHAQLRLAFERAVSEINSIVLRKIIITEVITVLIAMTYLIFIVVKLIHMFDEEHELFSYLSSIDKITRTHKMMAPRVTRMWSNYYYGKITKDQEINILGPSIDTIPSYLNVDLSNNQNIFNLSLIGLSYVDEFSNTLYHSDLNNGGNILNFTKLISDTEIHSATCISQNNSVLTDDQYTTIDFLWRSLFMISSRLVISSELENLTEKTYFLCETYTKNIMLTEAMKLITMNVSNCFSYEYQLLKRCNISHFTNNNQEENIPEDPNSCPDPSTILGSPKIENIPSNLSKQTNDTNLNFFIAFTPFLILALVYPATVFLSSALWTEKIEMTQKLKTFSKQECKDASEAIMKKTEEESHTENNSVIPNEKKTSQIIIHICNVVGVLSIIALLLVQLICGTIYHKKLNSIIEHSALVTSLCSTLISSAHDTLLYVFLNQAKNDGILTVNFIDLDFLESHIKNSLLSISLISNMLKEGYDNIPSAHKFIKKVDEIFNKQLCTPNSESKYPIDYYKCVSYSDVITYFIKSVTEMINSVDSYTINSEKALLFSKLIDTRLGLGYLELSETYEDTFNNTIHKFHLIVWICFSIDALLVFLSFGFEIYMVAVSNRDIDTFKCLILHVDPIAFASNPQALSLIYGKKSLADTQIISASHSVFYSSKDAMMSLNQDGVIESLNPAASIIFGYTPEQMLGQNIKLLINPEINKNNILFDTIQLMKSGQCSLIFESNLSGIKDDDTNFPIKVTLIGFSSNGRVADSFAIVCRDKTEEEKQQIELGNAKNEAKNLLLQFVPQEMLSKLSREEPETAFTVQSSTLIMINIVQFSTYITTLPPKEALENLSQIFKAFDKNLSMISSMTKIKVMGDVYFAASGLFNPEMLPSSHVADTVNFGLKCLDSIEALNIKLNETLQARIGVHTGGPTTAGVFGDNKQIFDIIGPVVSSVQKLEKSCIPGTMNISNDTLYLLQPGRFITEEHEMIDLVGTPKQMSFTVHPGHASASSTSKSTFAPMALDANALLSGSNSGSSFKFAPDDSGSSLYGSFNMPGLASLIDPEPEPK